MPRPKKVGTSKSNKKVTKKKVTKKKAKKKSKKKTAAKKKVETQEEIEQQEAEECEFLINKIKNSVKKSDIDAAFEEVVKRLKPRIQKLVNRFNISGLDSSDIMQEALFALRYKAIKDYDAERGRGIGWAPFERFAILCIRRHLSTEYKASYQNKKRVLNSSISLNQQTFTGPDEELSLINIIDSGEDDIIDQLQDREYYVSLMTKLVKSLSPFEKEVFVLYAQRYSYEEIADMINENRVKVKVNIKGVDNALSRIKHKAKQIFAQHEQAEQED